ncbi:MAG: glycosyltransferase family 2 protein [Stenotrophobium sp.]
MDDMNHPCEVKMHHLQSAIWPRDTATGTPEELCLRAAPKTFWRLDPAGGIRALRSGTTDQMLLDFGTFFGAFSLTTWCGSAGIDQIILKVNFKGACTLRIYSDNGYEGRSLLWSDYLSCSGSDFDVTLPGLRGHRGILYPEFEVHQGDNFELHKLEHYADKAPNFSPRLAIVMPTYKREAYARRNIDLISQHVLKNAGGACRLYVIDNGHSLNLPPIEGVELIQNRNYGGSGGFARGVLEAYSSSLAFTHVLFCDDDVLIEPQSINRLRTLLGYVGQDTVISGGMLKMASRQVLHEKSANVVGMRFSSNRGNDDITKIEAVARYDEPGYSTFCGWWFVCYPLIMGEEQFLPFPFFVGWDDVEMGRRCNRANLRTVSLLGVAVWHEEFEKKDTTWRWYYHTRNGIVTSMLYDNGRQALRQVIVEIMTALLTYRYERAEFMIDGMAAVTDGCASISNHAADELHATLLARQKTKLVDVSRMVVPGKMMRQVKPSILRKLVARISMNGHLLPLSFFKPAREPVDAGWAVEHLHSTRLVTIYRCPHVVYYEPATGKGMLCKVDHRRFFHLLLRMLLQWMRLRFRWAAVRTQWRAGQAEMTSPTFWMRYLGMKK